MRTLGAALAATLVVASFLLAAVVFAGGTYAKRPRLTVFAAASLTNVFPQIDTRPILLRRLEHARSPDRRRALPPTCSPRPNAASVALRTRAW